MGRNLWDRRYPVVDEERGIVLSMVRFGLKDGRQSQSTATANSRIVAEFFAVKRGLIQEVQAVLFDGIFPRHPAYPVARRLWTRPRRRGLAD